MGSHKDLVDGNIHVLHDKEYADTTARDADTEWNSVPTNIGKVVKVTAGPTWYILNTVTPTWTEITTTVSQSLSGVLSNGNTSGSTDLVMDAGQGIVVGGGTRTADAALDLKAVNQAILMNRVTTMEKNALTAVQGMIVYDTDINEPQHYNGTAWVGVSASDTLAEILAKGNFTGGTDLLVSTGDVITITDAPVAGTSGTNMTYVKNVVNSQSGHGFYQGPADSAVHIEAQTFLNGVPAQLDIVTPYAVEDERLPFGASGAFWDPLTSLIEQDQEQGEWIARVAFDIQSAAKDKYLNVDFRIFGGSSIGENNVRMIKDAITVQPISMTFPFFGSASSFADGIEIVITAEGTDVIAFNQSVYVSKTGGET